MGYGSIAPDGAKTNNRHGAPLTIVFGDRICVKKLKQTVTITFLDRETEKRALGFLLGRFSGRVLRTGEHLVPEAALEALADQNIQFEVKGKAGELHD